MMIRRATADDAPACARIVDDWFAATEWMPKGPGRARLERIMRDGFPVRDAWVADDAGTTLGYLSMKAEGDHIFGLYAATPGAGIGKRLLTHVKQGRDRLTLNSHMPNTAAHRFYEREGFRIIDRDVPGDDGVPELVMEWRR
ncbi:GNAT family N-acetyltransferase [Jannaschia donghaensis]|uniref:Putative N-acetyltransferase YjaB n=1 Tax=Jannaschia donghaensis TaxID=420998 RepID=A0A0M6YEL2_9RHOB|nr:GNAT family N-acetyltransferase [Jannaschia donghaensis]CTQ48768.1 putative N-acetyltransferase YjaB [Jannaschia donghaensis]